MKVFAVDDHSVVIEGVKSLIDRMEEFEFAGSEMEGLNVLSSLREADPSIVILDISMPDKDGIELAEEIVAWNDAIKILIYSMSASKEHILALFRIGVSGYVLKHEPMSELRLALSSLKEGASFFSSEVRDILQDHLKELELGHGKDVAEVQNGIAVLSNREKEVFVLLADGLTVKEIADRLCISPKTVESHKYNILDKLDEDSIANLTKIAAKKGLIDI